MSTLLFPLLFSIIDYGMYFNDSFEVKQGIREGSRRAVVQNFTGNSCYAATPSAAQIGCLVKDETHTISTSVETRVVVPAAGWKKGELLLVCSIVPAKGVLGLTPLPNSGLLYEKVKMSIETDTIALPAGTTTSGTPAGASWSWCQ